MTQEVSKAASKVEVALKELSRAEETLVKLLQGLDRTRKVAQGTVKLLTTDPKASSDKTLEAMSDVLKQSNAVIKYFRQFESSVKLCDGSVKVLSVTAKTGR